MNYYNQKCSHCGRKFTKDDDVVVCPVCGTPQHRDCYEEHNKCINYNKHSENYVWTPEDVSEKSSEDNYIICKKCGTKNTDDSFFCKHCSEPLNNPNNANINGYNIYDDTENDSENFEEFIKKDFSDNSNPILNFSFNTMNDNEEIAKNVTLEDAKKYVQKNTFFYSIIFRNLSTLNRSRFNFAACLFGGGWFIYRKQYRLGIILTIIMGICLCGYIVFLPNFANIYNEIYNSGITSDSQFYVELITNYPDQLWTFMAPGFFKIVQFTVMIISGFIGNRHYYNHVIDKVNQAKSEFNTKEEVYKHLEKTGGVDSVIGYVLLIGYVILTTIPTFMFKIN